MAFRFYPKNDVEFCPKPTFTMLTESTFQSTTSSSNDTALFELFARLTNRIRATPALFAVLDEVSEIKQITLSNNQSVSKDKLLTTQITDQPVEVCDESKIVQYVNKAYENFTSCSRSEVLGAKSSEARRKSINTCYSRSRDGDGDSSHRNSSDWRCVPVPSSSISTQYAYMKRGSVDAILCRDTSLKSVRSQNALVDAPISEALILLREAMQRSDENTQQTLKDAIRVLSSAEVYAPSITRFTTNDRIASNYYDGLVRPHYPRQRKRSAIEIFKEKRNSTSEGRRRVSGDVRNCLSNDQEWTFDVLQLEKITDNHALSQLGIKTFDRWKVHEHLHCLPETIAHWFNLIEANYHSSNPYHNATHAADVLQATSYFLDSPVVMQHVQDSHAIAALIAAAVHDLDHPGRGNPFLINTRQPLALIYNDQSVLENHHVAFAFQLTLQASNNANIFAKLKREEFVAIRQAIVEMVLATDMSKHFEYLAKFQQAVINRPTDAPETDEDRNAVSLTVCRMMIKCADIGNPTREWALCQKWAMRVVEEYFEQTVEEREKGLPLTMELFDRNTCNVPLTQCGFIDMFAREAFMNWSEFAELPELLMQLEANYENWRQRTSSWKPSDNVFLSCDS
uniref:Phosphodiesterase n=1 Tax=Syphacia muris TaxID=451379 RepID=A0A0N5AZ29_9BILA